LVKSIIYFIYLNNADLTMNLLKIILIFPILSILSIMWKMIMKMI